jgi:uncharacterized membrane protein YbhN (UPF0104 family)
LQPPQAAAAVSALALLGVIADVLAFGAIMGLGTVSGLAGVTGEVPLLVNRIVGLLPAPSGWWLWVAAGGGLAVLATACVPRRRTGAILHGLAGGLRTYGVSLRALARRPSRLAALVIASAGTTVLLAAGFAAVATLGPTALPASSFCALMIGYMIASAAGNALPTPGGIGTADAALIGVLVAARMPVASAVASVLAFRLVTFWAPAAVGLCLVWPLRRRGAL